jgi:hypothetical protein
MWSIWSLLVAGVALVVVLLHLAVVGRVDCLRHFLVLLLALNFG